MKKIIIITGLTGSGKSGLAIDLAKEFNGEIISADSVQVYKGLNIGSAKEPIESRNGVVHHLIDIKDYNETYNVGEFVGDCKTAIDKIIKNKHLPIIVGGTGMYIKALMEGYTLGGAKSNLYFRNKYETLAKEQGNLAVWNELKAINPSKAESVHPNNLKRVIRYLEIENGDKSNEEIQESILKDFNVLCVGIVDNRDEIYSKINNRVDLMISQGLETEVKQLIKKGATRDMQAFNSIGYKEWFDYFEDKTSKDKTIDLIKQHTRNYCKRQLTFLKTIKNIDICTKSEANNKIRRFLND